MKRLFVALLTLTGLASGLAQSALAQSESGALHLITSPLPVNLVATPGQTVSTELRIRNAGSQTELLKTGLLKFKAFGDSGSPKLLDREVGDDYFDWVSFSEKQFSIAPNEWHSVTMSIKVPATAAFGYYYAATFSRANAGTPTAAQPQTALVGATATLVLLEAKVPNAKREVQLEDFRTDKPWYEFLPVTFTTKLRNTGNVHVAPSGNIFIETASGKPVTTLEVNTAKGNILPNSSRSFTSTWDDGFPVYQQEQADGAVVKDKNGQTAQHLSWDLSKANRLRFGHYTAHLTMVYDDGKKDVPVDASVSFWVVPWRMMVGGLVIGFFVLLGMYSAGKGLWRKFKPGEGGY